MKKQNIRNTVIDAVIAAAIFAAVTLFVLWRLGIFDRTPDPVPNADFGLVEEVYHPYATIPITDLEGDTDAVTIDSILPNRSNDVYHEFAPTIESNGWDFHFGRYREYKEGEDALTLNLSATVHGSLELVQTALRYDFGDMLPAPDGLSYTHPEGYIEKRGENGEWMRVGRPEFERDEYLNSRAGRVLLHTLESGKNYIDMDFPIHEPGEYRITYNFRTLSDLFILRPSTGDELYTVSHTVTVPEASDKKFDVVSVELEHSGGMARVAALIRSNDGTIPLQHLTKTKLERFKDGEWSDVSESLTELYEIVGNDYSDRANVAYETRHPFTREKVTNLFCGVAEFEAFDAYDAGVLYRLTLEFIDGYKTDAARYALQLVLDLS